MKATHITKLSSIRVAVYIVRMVPTDKEHVHLMMVRGLVRIRRMIELEQKLWKQNEDFNPAAGIALKYLLAISMM